VSIVGPSTRIAVRFFSATGSNVQFTSAEIIVPTISLKLCRSSISGFQFV